ncbi:unnamed protein product [Ilex paraguariensis]|uniref:Uncharacterized protein n=1 Tax=Ilex paraguariensis TaxID=185542 RepID=A0ABC8RWC9_9AQUA
MFQTFSLHVTFPQKRQPSINWKVYEEPQCQDCSSLLEVSHLTDSCKATFHASVGELFVPISFKCLDESEEERMFISRRLHIMGEKNLVEDLICTGCQLCGAPLNLEFRSSIKQETIPLYCQKSSNRLHIVGLIYRPFMLYVWDDSKYIPLLVTNKAAELLFGNIRAEIVHSCHRRQNHRENHDMDSGHQDNDSYAQATLQSNAAGRDISNSRSTGTAKGFRLKGKRQFGENLNFYLIWVILLKMLLLPGKNSPLKFKVKVNATRDWESGRCEMVSVTMPCFRTNLSSA